MDNKKIFKLLEMLMFILNEDSDKWSLPNDPKHVVRDWIVGQLRIELDPYLNSQKRCD